MAALTERLHAAFERLDEIERRLRRNSLTRPDADDLENASIELEAAMRAALAELEK